ncbi:hypothetical protein ACF07Y_29010 [Streptomyces sp. NPDC016566]|uniref:hypothetical protein n=1 Tax=Streptomyces sp. NPDC016566 TaxID=3364967 RepID=UPI0036FF24F4
MAVFAAPDGTPRLATGSHDGTVRIWNPRNRKAHTLFLADQVYALTEHRGLLIAGTDSGYLGIDISSVPIDPPMIAGQYLDEVTVHALWPTVPRAAAKSHRVH